MTVAIITNTPEPMVWERYTIGMIRRRFERLGKVAMYFGLSTDNDGSKGSVIDSTKNPEIAVKALKSLGV